MVKGRHIIHLVNEEKEHAYSFSSLAIPDVTLACSDGRLTVDLPTLGLLFPQLAELVPLILQAPLAVLLPQHSLGELVTRLQEVTQGAVVLEMVEEEVKKELVLDDRTINMDLQKDYQDDVVVQGDKFIQLKHTLMNIPRETEVASSVVSEEDQIEFDKHEVSLKRKRTFDKIRHKKLLKSQGENLLKSELMDTEIMTDSDVPLLLDSDDQGNNATSVRVLPWEQEELGTGTLKEGDNDPLARVVTREQKELGMGLVKEIVTENQTEVLTMEQEGFTKLTKEQERLVVGMVKEGVADQEATRFLNDLTGLRFIAQDVRNMMDSYIEEGETFEYNLTKNIDMKPNSVDENASSLDTLSSDEKESKPLHTLLST